ncbi:MAG: hypothetical protein ACTSXQ_06700 [Alphaproteobacteria bacterium]
MTTKNPVLVYIYGPEINKPTYEELLLMQEACLQIGQDIIIIPPPKEDGSREPAFPPSELSSTKIQDVLDEKFSAGKDFENREVTFYFDMHGSYQDNRFIFAEFPNEDPAFLEKNTLDILSVTTNMPKVTGDYIATCRATPALFNIQDLLLASDKTEGIFQYVGDASLHENARQTDSAALVQALPLFAKNMRLDPKNIHRIYLKILGDNHERRDISTFEKSFNLAASDLWDKEEIPHEDLDKKLGDLLQKEINLDEIQAWLAVGDETQALSISIDGATRSLNLDERQALKTFFSGEYLEDFKFCSLILAASETTDDIREVTDKPYNPQVYGDLLLLADIFSPDENAVIKEHLIELKTAKGEKFGDIFNALTSQEQLNVATEMPELVFINFKHLKISDQDTHNKIVMNIAENTRPLFAIDHTDLWIPISQEVYGEAGLDKSMAIINASIASNPTAFLSTLPACVQGLKKTYHEKADDQILSIINKLNQEGIMKSSALIYLEEIKNCLDIFEKEFPDDTQNINVFRKTLQNTAEYSAEKNPFSCIANIDKWMPAYKALYPKQIANNKIRGTLALTGKNDPFSFFRFSNTWIASFKNDKGDIPKENMDLIMNIIKDVIDDSPQKNAQIFIDQARLWAELGIGLENTDALSNLFKAVITQNETFKDQESFRNVLKEKFKLFLIDKGVNAEEIDLGYIDPTQSNPQNYQHFGNAKEYIADGTSSTPLDIQKVLQLKPREV